MPEPQPMLAAETACTTEPARACLAVLRDLAGAPDRPMERHCLRVYEIACELGRLRGGSADRELLLCAAWLHDAGLYPAAATGAAYVRDGRALAERVLARFDWRPERLARAGDAVERHHEVRRQWRRGVEVELLRRADLVDVSQGLVRYGLEAAWLRDLRRRVPPDGMVREISRLLLVAARERPLTLPAIFFRR